MKKVILFLLVCVTNISVFGQYINFPDSNAVWSVTTKKYFIDGDSTLNSIKYKKYNVSNDSIINAGSFFALLREDTAKQQIFAISHDSSAENLLYDFSLKVNDTSTVFPISFDYYKGPVKIKVDLIDSVKIGNRFHKRLKISGVDQNTNLEEYWIEGIGSTMGLFNSGITGIVIFDVRYGILLCFEENGVLLYRDSNANTCYQNPTIGMAESVTKNQISFFPNPAINSFTIESNDEIELFRTFSITGKVFEQRKCHNKSVDVDISNYPSGVYLIIVQTKSGIISKRIIKNDI